MILVTKQQPRMQGRNSAVQFKTHLNNEHAVSLETETLSIAQPLTWKLGYIYIYIYIYNIYIYTITYPQPIKFHECIYVTRSDKWNSAAY